MMHRSNKNINILAIESGISGGSLAVISGGEIVGELLGDTTVSRAEDLLVKIDEIVRSTIGSKRNIDSIAVSAGPGSFTGLRIGLATAMGLSSALGIRYLGIPLLRSMGESAAVEGRLVAVIPIGKIDLCFQRFERKDGKLVELTPARTGPRDHLLSEIAALIDTTVVAHNAVIESEEASDLKFNSNPWLDIGSGLASVIGKYALKLDAEFASSPIYVQSPRFS